MTTRLSWTQRFHEGPFLNSLDEEERRHLFGELDRRNGEMALLLGWVILLVSVILIAIDIERWRQGRLVGSPLYVTLLGLHAAFMAAGVLSAALALKSVQQHPARWRRVLRWQMLLTGGSVLAMGVLAIVERGTLVMMAIALWLVNLVFHYVPHGLRLMASVGVLVAGGVSIWALSDGHLATLLPRLGELSVIALFGVVVGNAITRGRIQQIVSEFREARRMALLQRDVDVAASLQQALLPRRWPADRRIGLWGLMRPAKDIGGDFYDHFPVGGGRLGLVVADVSGKGVTAGLFSMVAKTRLRSIALNSNISPRDVIAGLNRELCDGNDESLFLTALYAQYDAANGRLEFVNAGHPPPLHISAAGEVTWVKGVGGGMPLAILDDSTYEPDVLTLMPGDTVVLYSDGVTEATAPSLVEFGAERLCALFRGQPPASPQEAVERITRAIEAHAQGTQAADDVTCLALRREAVSADAFPSKPIRFIVPSEPGTSPDRVARTLSAIAAEQLGQPIVVENRPEDFGLPACLQAVQSEPDGHTVLALLSAVAFQAALRPTVSIAPERDLAPVALLAGGPNILVVHPSAPVANLDELLAWARRVPEPLSCASGGSMTSQHMSGMLLGMIGRCELRMDIYPNTADSLQAVIDGLATMAFVNVPMAHAHVKAGRLKALGVSVDESLPALPGLAPLSNRLQGFNVSAWFGLAAPAGTPDHVVQRLHQAYRSAQSHPQARAVFGELGLQMQSGSSEDFSALVRSEVAIWQGVLQAVRSSPL